MIPLLIHDRGAPTSDVRLPRIFHRRSAGLLLLAGLLALGGCRPSEAPAKAAAETSERRAEAPAKEGESEKKEAQGGEEHGLKLSAEEAEAAGIRVEALAMQAVADQVVLTATIHANQDRIVRLAPRVPARLAQVGANLGDQVRAGQVLATLDSIDVGEAQATYRQAKSQFAMATADFERAAKLKAEEIISEKDYLRARSEHEKAKAALRAAESRLQLLGAVDARDSGAGSLMPLRAPFAGTVIEKKAVLGELAQPDKTLFTVADLSTLWIEANLFEKDLGRVRLGAAATVTVGAYPGESFKGRLTYISSTLDRETRAVPARIEVPNPDRRLKPEMFATAAIAGGGSVQALTVPQAAVLLINGQPTIFVREAAGFEPRAVELGANAGDRVAIKGGVKAGETVVVAGAYALKARLLKSQIGDAH